MAIQPIISVIMPCYNAAAHLEASIASALQQTHSDIELIIINDGSTDNSFEILQAIEDPRVRIVNQINKGVCAARNRGLTEAHGDFVAFLDADDSWHPEFLQELLTPLIGHTDIALSYCGWQNLGLNGGAGEPFIPPDYEGPDKLEKLLQNCRWPIHAALTRKSYIEEVGGFDERFVTSEDFLLWLKIGAVHKIVRVPRVLAYYHHHDGDQATKNRLKGALNHYGAQKAFLSDYPDLACRLNRTYVRELTLGELLRRGYISYWDRDMKTARIIFRQVMKAHYGSAHDWKYMLPSLLPLPIHKAIVALLGDS